jgi:glycosyltransferase involved in cell wall biosynthesis
MRILYSLSHATDTLASERAGHLLRASALLAELSRQGHEVLRIEAAGTQGSAAAVGAYRGVVRRLLPRAAALKLRDAGRLVMARRSGRRLIAAARAFRPDVILETHTSFGLAGQMAAAATGAPLVLDDVAPPWEEAEQYGAGLAELAGAIYRRVIGEASLLVAVAEPIRRHLMQCGVSEQRIIDIENGIDPALFHAAVDGRARRAELGLGGSDVAIVYVGSFQPFHRVPLLLESFARLRDERLFLILVGEGRTQSECRAMVAALGIGDRVAFVGRVPYHDVPAFIAAADIAVQPATLDYGDSMKLREFMAVGRPVIAPRVPAIARHVDHERTGILFEADDPAALAAAIARLAADPPRRSRLGETAACLAANHSWALRAATLAGHMERVCAGPATAAGA